MFITFLALIACSCGPGVTPTHDQQTATPRAPSAAAGPESTAATPSPEAAPTMTPVPTLPSPATETLAPGTTAESYIALYKIVVAGDYYAVHVAADGHAEYTRHSRSYEILERKEGNLGREGAAELCAQLRELGLYGLEASYPLEPAGEGTPEEEYEDVYYWIRVVDGEREKTILAHEAASPPELKQVIGTLMDTGSNLPEGDGAGRYLLAAGYDTLSYLRREEGMASLVLDERSRQMYPAVEMAVRGPCSLVSWQEQAGADAGQLFVPGTHMMEVMLSDERFIVLLLTQ